MNLPARCSARSEELGETIFGTASTVRHWLLIEHTGPWGRRPLLDARLPRGIAAELRRVDRSLGVRVLLIRRPAGSLGMGTRCFAIRSGPGDSWIQRAILGSLTDVVDLDLVALSRGRDPGLDPVSGPLFLVCTHGRRDPCCAERGRPLARALADADPDATWESTHVGGDRFAGNVVAFPHGMYFGRVAPADAEAVAHSYRRARIDLAHFRGRSCDPMIVQAGEHFLREHLNLVSVDDVRPVSVRRDGARATVRFETRAGLLDVSLERGRTEPRPLTCHADLPLSAPSYRLLAIES
jgi:hypothetical protein